MLSRLPFIKRSRGFTLHIQLSLADFLDKCFAAIKEGKVLAKKLKKKIGEETDDIAKSELIKELDGVQMHLFAHKNVARIAKYVVDGIAWRRLNYDRPIIRLLSSNKRAISIDVKEPGLRGVLNVARGITTRHKSYVIINDLTNFIRIGDLTEIHKKAIYIHECKQKGKLVRNIFTLLRDLRKIKNISKQTEQLLTAQTAITHRKIIVNDKLTVQIEDLDVPFYSHLRAVKSVISKTRRKGYYSKSLASYLFVTCLDLKKAAKQTKVVEWKRSPLPVQWNQKDFIVPFTNTDTFYKNEDAFIPNWTPYSIFPFSAKSCMALLSGNIVLTALLNLTKLYEFLGDNGWEVDGANEEDLVSRYDASMPLVPNPGIAYQYDETLCILKRGAFRLALPATLVFRIGMDFLSPKTILLEAEKLFNDAVPLKEDILAINLTQEKRVWN